jgi:hypothetical protein
MGLIVNLYKPVEKFWVGTTPQNVKTVSSKEGNEKLMQSFSNLLYESGELEFNLNQAFVEKNVTSDELLWVSTKKQDGFPIHHFTNKYTGQVVIIDEVPMQVSVYRNMYVTEIDRIEISDVPSAYQSLKRIGLTYISKTELIKEISEFFPTYLSKFSKWWDNKNSNIQFKKRGDVCAF